MSGLQDGVDPGDGEEAERGSGVSRHSGSGRAGAGCELGKDTTVTRIRAQIGCKHTSSMYKVCQERGQ